MGHVGTDIVDKAIKAMSANKLPFEILTNKQISEKFPQLKYDEKWRAVYDPSAGTLKSDRCLHALQVSPLIRSYIFEALKKLTTLNFFAFECNFVRS